MSRKERNEKKNKKHMKNRTFCATDTKISNDFTDSFHQSNELSTAITQILQMRKLRPREYIPDLISVGYKLKIHAL